jgi:hypothetical protein
MAERVKLQFPGAAMRFLFSCEREAARVAAEAVNATIGVQQRLCDGVRRGIETDKSYLPMRPTLLFFACGSLPANAA